MKTLLKQAHADVDVDVEGALKVIDRFDQLMVGGATLDRLLLAAANASGRDVGIEDTWSDRRLRAESGHVRQIELWDERGMAVIEAAIRKRLRGHRPGAMTAVGRIPVSTAQNTGVSV